MYYEKAIALLLPVFLSLGYLAGCTAAPAETTTAATTTIPTTEEPDVFVTATIIKDAKSDYVIVHDGSADAQQFANDVKSAIIQATA